MSRRSKYILIILVIVALYSISWYIDFSFGKEPIFGITFSQFYAEEILQLDWRQVYEAILRDLRPQTIRLVAYWQYVEPKPGVYNFSDLQWQIEEAEKNNARVMLVVGHRVPRWPECHSPEWARHLPPDEFEKELLMYIEAVINHFKSSSVVFAWQIENEPFLSAFGVCPRYSRDMFEKELALVQTIDFERPVVITESGELSLWVRASGKTEVLGTTLYRVVWNSYIGFFKHVYPPAWYALRAKLVKVLSSTEEVIISELQAEPWTLGGGYITDVAFDTQTDSFNVSDLRSIAHFAKRTGIKEAYLWGAEWWYWRKVNGDSSWWEAGQTLIQ